MKRTDLSQNAHVPSKRITPLISTLYRSMEPRFQWCRTKPLEPIGTFGAFGTFGTFGTLEPGLLLPRDAGADAEGARPADRAERCARGVVLGVEDVLDREERVQAAHHLTADRRIPHGVLAQDERLGVEVVVELLAA